MYAFLHISIGFVGKTIPPDDVQMTFTRGAGWARYAPNCWIVFTNESPDAIRDRLRAICDEKDSIFICELKIETASGYMQGQVWDWITTNRKIQA